MTKPAYAMVLDQHGNFNPLPNDQNEHSTVPDFGKWEKTMTAMH